MATGVLRSTAELTVAVTRWCAHLFNGEHKVGAVEITRPKAGWSNETILVAVSFDGPIVGGHVERLVLRLPSLAASFPTYDLPQQAAVHRLLRAEAFTVPDILAVETTTEWLGAPFIAMSFIDGRPISEVPSLDRWLMAAPHATQQRVIDGFVAKLAALHRLPNAPQNAPPTLRFGLAQELTYWSGFIEWAADGRPALRLRNAIDWCCATVPHHHGADSLLWGDARLGNVMYDTDGEVVALLDWELASVGPPEMDLAWFVALDELTRRYLPAEVPGFPQRTQLIERYETQLGRPVEHFAWHEIFALVRSTAVNDRQARVAARAGTKYPGVAGDANPILDVIDDAIARFAS